MDEDGYFGDLVAARYDASTAEMSEPGVVEPAVGLLAGLAGSGQSAVARASTARSRSATPGPPSST